MAKEYKVQIRKESAESEQSGDSGQLETASEMTLEEARAYRASLHKPEHKEPSLEEKRNQFRMWWAEQKYRFGKGKDLEPILWMHLKAIDHTKPEQFEKGLQNFGLTAK